jgi:sugar phosphate isomerase/epimerase
MQRRTFLEIGSATALGAIVVPNWAESLLKGKGLKNIGVQLYTVRDDMQKDPVSTLKRIAEIGYSHVECAGYRNGTFYGKEKTEFKKILSDLGLKMHSGHAMTGFGMPAGTYSMTYEWEKYCADASFMGQKYIVSAYFMDGERKTLDDYRKHAKLFTECALIAKKHGLTFCHHNHDFEFVPIDGVVPYDIFIKETDASLVKFELDFYWTKKANVDTVKLITENPDRFPLFHIKDMELGAEQSFTEVGNGVIDWKNVFGLSKKAGMDLFYVEQDSCKNMKPLESIEVSYKYLSNLKV